MTTSTTHTAVVSLPSDTQILITRDFNAPRHLVYRAHVEPDLIKRWWAGERGQVDSAEVDLRVGGRFKMSFTHFGSSASHSFGGEYRELVPNDRLRYSDKFDDPAMPGEMETTVILTAVACGTELKVEQSGIPAMIPLEMCYLGWQESLAQLAQLVEPEIPN